MIYQTITNKVKPVALRILATVLLAASYSIVAVLSRLSGRRGRGMRRSSRILVIGTFHNPNWFHSHIGPLCQCGVQEVILVCDHPMDQKERLRYACPPRIVSMLLSRAAAKFIWAVLYGIRFRPDLYMGYHIFPAAISALAAARILNRPACYQVTSGQTELEGGGWLAENRILNALGAPSSAIEKMASAVVSEFDLVVVRGSGAKKYLRAFGYERQLAIITGSAEVPQSCLEHNARDIDVIFVGRLTDCKRPDQFVAIMQEVVRLRSTLKAVMIGDGPNEEKLIHQIAGQGLQGNVELLGKRKDVATLMARSRVFVLTSRSEGLSIAMIEAMMSGVVPVVADVGDLKDLVQDGVNGYVVAGDDIATFLHHILRLLDESDLWQCCSRNASDVAKDYSSIDAITGKWRDEIDVLMKQRTMSP